MREFKDSAGRTWSLAINIGAVKRVKSLLGVDLLDLLATAKGEDLPLMTRLARDVILRIDVIFALVKPQADDAGVTDLQFGEALGGEAILAASEGFFGELTDFFRGMGRAELVKALEKQRTVLQKAAELIGNKVDAIDPDSLLQSVGGPSGSLPASSASTPAA